MLGGLKNILIMLMCLYCLSASAQSFSELESSVLSKGHWVKLQVNEEGLYSLSAKTLSSLGFSDISKVAVYGNGGKELPLSNSADRVVDLVKLPVCRTKSELVFFTGATQNWTYNYSTSQFQCSQNQYDDKAYVFITDSQAPSDDPIKAEIVTKDVASEITYNSTLVHHELHNISLFKSGRDWYGETLTKSASSLEIDLGNFQRVLSQEIVLNVRLCAASSQRVDYTVSYNDSVLITNNIRALGSSELGVNSQSSKRFKLQKSPARNVVSIKCALPQLSDKAYLDYITAEIPTALQMPSSGVMCLNIAEGTRRHRGEASVVTISNASAEDIVWCVDDATRPTLVTSSFSNNKLSFTQDNSEVHKYVVFNPSKISSFPEPSFVSEVENQNLHATPAVDYIIVYHPMFKAQAEELAEIHRQYSALDVYCASTDDIYNEFNGGQRSATAIRDYVRFVYKKSNGKLRYLLLFGEGSYDNLSYGSANPYNLVPTYQSIQSLHDTQSYVTDDFFAWLEDDELVYDTRANVDIGVGRFPIYEVEDAQIMVDRVKNYLTKPQYGAWMNTAVMAACSGDNNEHAMFANENADLIAKYSSSVNTTRVIAEAYTSVQSTTGRSYPQAISDFYNAINNQGAFLVNYVGHGGPLALQLYFETAKISRLANKDKLPFMIAATCEFAPFDNEPNNATKQLVLYPYGGMIGVLTATRTVFGNNNHSLNVGMIEGLLTPDSEGNVRRLGDAVRFAKLKTPSMTNSLKYVLIGDPAVTLVNNAEYIVQTDSICGEPYESCITPLKALTANKIAGTIRDASGNIVENFNGEVEVSLYDKQRIRSTLGSASPVYKYTEWGNRLFHSKFKVTDGRFDATIQLSKDIDATEGYGRLSYFAWADTQKAKGASDMVLVGGFADALQLDTVGPDLKVYMDYPQWQDGGVTSSSPMLFAEMSDISGINAAGVGIGHNITLTIDDDPNTMLSLDNYYSHIGGEGNVGQVKYQLSEMSSGHHTLSLKVWDNAGNSSEKRISMHVSSVSQIKLSDVVVYPSTFTSLGEPLSLRFFHNNAGFGNTLHLAIYDLSGKLMASTQTTLPTGASDSGVISLTDLMPRISGMPNGVYVLNVKLIGSNGRRGEITRKLAF